MKRKEFILLAAGIAAIAIPYYYLSDVKYDSTMAEPKSLSMIWDEATIHAIGNKYRTQVPDEKSERTLAKLLLEDISSEANALEQKIINDFENGRTIMIDGWILSVTEARQCALFSINQTK